MKTVASIFFLLLSFSRLQAQKNGSPEIDMLQAGDTVVFTADTTVIVGFKPGTGSMSAFEPDSGLFIFDRVSYRLESISVVYYMGGDGVVGPYFGIRGYEIGGDHYFSAMLSASVKYAKDYVRINKCKFSYANVGLHAAACELVLRKQSCEPSDSHFGITPCKLSASDNEKSLAYAIEQYIVKTYKERQKYRIQIGE